MTLHGARFAPTVYVNGVLAGRAAGGMAPTTFVLRNQNVAPGRTIQLEIALTSLRDLSIQDPSAVPYADRWRTNDSSGLWDSVTLHLSGETRFTSVIPFTDFKARALSLHWIAEASIRNAETVRALVLAQNGAVLASSARLPANALHGEVSFPIGAKVQPWSPEHPHVYRVALLLEAGGRLIDRQEQSWGLKDFRASNKRFFLNGQPIQMRGGSVVWTRFVRHPEAKEIAWDADWFQRNVFLRLKDLGANTLRFHLGLPPEAFLDLCDKDGLMVQMEWPFFHSEPASEASMAEQWQAWLTVAMRHPSVMIVHGWNETGGEELKAAWRAMDVALAPFPPLVVAHRDTLHLHKYWWSLFENLGLYYDSADQFDRAIVVDEFGGNYLDQNGDPGGYPATREAFARFLGRNHTRDMRLEFHAEANARIGEYWRRIGAAGILPFCILGSLEDGNSWFLGPLRTPAPMPVWDALTATFSPVSLSLDVWNRNYSPGQLVRLPLYFFNDTGEARTLNAEVAVGTQTGSLRGSQPVHARVAAHATVVRYVTLTLPRQAGDWKFTATLQNPVPGVRHPIVSAWNDRSLTPKPSPALSRVSVGVAENETELRAFLQQNGIAATALDDPAAKLLLTSRTTWANLSPHVREILSAAVGRGASVVMLDAGPQALGQGYRKGDLGPLDGTPVVKEADSFRTTQDLFRGVQVTFSSIAEPESHVQPGPEDNSLWQDLPQSATWIWNGLRGGLIAPAAGMSVSGQSVEAYLAQWAAKGADASTIRTGSAFAFELGGYYAFSVHQDDASAIAALRKRVKFLADDAPALQAVLDPNAPVTMIDLSAGFRAAAQGQARDLVPLSTCGRGLTRTSVVELTFGEGKGKLIFSQLLTAGRLRRGYAEPGPYGIRYDPAAEQMVLNMLEKTLAAGAIKASSAE